MKDYYDTSDRAPYLQSSRHPSGNSEDNDPLDASEHTSFTSAAATSAVDEQADAVTDSMLKRVSSFGILTGGGLIPRTSSRKAIPEFLTEAERSLPPLPRPINSITIVPTWRLKDRMKTVGVGLIMALNVGTDPPDVTKPNPCAKLQCWMDPTSVSRAKAKEKIGERLEMQYAKWQQQRTAKPLKYRRALDPTVEDVRGLCLGLRRQAKTERILLHYNGHGVPRPTSNGEIWVFDKNHTQYIPLSVTDLRHWVGKPSIVVLDCGSAGVLLPFITSSLDEVMEDPSTYPYNPTNTDNNEPIETATEDSEMAAAQCVRDTIVLCPTSEGEWLPMHPEYPADIFTSCLTTPIKMALRWFVRRNAQSMGGLDPESVDAIPGLANDRKTPLGELNWIFTAVTDSIAWNVLPKSLFSRLFRQDLLVASMFRNFLLADRILRSLNCTPQSYPPLPPGVCDHPLWQAWDLACESCLHGLIRDGYLGNPDTAPVGEIVSEMTATSAPPTATTPPTSPNLVPQGPLVQPAPKPSTPHPTPSPVINVSSPFFSEQLTAFEIWLEFASIHKDTPGAASFEHESPEQLPVVLQVLLSQAHRIRALVLLRRFLNLGPWAVNLALSLGIFPYVMKLLQSPEYKHVLVGIWAKILAFDPSCQVDLVKDGALPHFIHHLSWGLNKATAEIAENYRDAAEQRTKAAFILSVTCLRYTQGQAESLRQNLHGSCCALLSDIEASELEAVYEVKQQLAEVIFPPSFRLWLCLCLGNLVKDNNNAQKEAYGAGAHVCLFARLKDESPDVRAAACYALGCLIGSPSNIPARQGTDAGMVARPDVSQGGMMGPHVQPQGVLRGGLNQMQHGLVSPRFLSPTAQPITAAASILGVGAQLQPTFSPANPGIQLNAQQLPQGVLHPQPSLQGQPFTVHPTPYNPNMPTDPGPASGMTPIRQSLTTMVQGQPSLMSPQYNPGSNSMFGEPSSVFEDSGRLDLDLSVLNAFAKAAEDASPLVRYEVMMSLALAVGKYLAAFAAVAEEITASLKTNVRKIIPTDGSDVITLADALNKKNNSIPFPYGIDRSVADKFASVWKSLRSLQHSDLHPAVSYEANTVVSVVHEHTLSLKLELELTRQIKKERPDDKTQAGNRNLGKSMQEDFVGIDDNSTSDFGFINIGSSPSAGMDYLDPLRRAGSTPILRSAQSQEFTIATPKLRRIASKERNNTSGDQFKIEYILPKSKFYQWKHDAFYSIGDDIDRNLLELDPLSPEGAVQAYRERRNSNMYETSKKLKERYTSLAPTLPKKQSDSDMFFDDEEAVALEQKATSKKRELEFRQSALLANKGVDMTSMLRFHPFEDALVVADGSDGLSVWDVKTSKRGSTFKNGNPKGSRMTSTQWINGASSSLFLVGSDDGSIRIWDGLLESDGESRKEKPSLSSAFSAAHDLISGERGSGLIVDWQQYSGRLITGGNSKWVNCWDLGAEQCVSTFERKGDACITTLTTAWDYDPHGQVLSTEGYRGYGPDVVVAGYSDGCMKIFDIRSNVPAAEVSLTNVSPRKSARGRGTPAKYAEHKSWIVDTSFTSFGGRYEIVSGSVAGDIKAWDLRLPSSLRTLEVQRSPLTALATHSKIPMIASGSHAQFIKILTPDGDTLQVIRYHEKKKGHRIGPVSCLEFHPHKALMAVGATDANVSIYSLKREIL